MKQPSSWGVTQDGTYDTGDLIPAAGLEMTLGGLASRWGGFLSIPQPGKAAEQTQLPNALQTA